MARNIKRRKDAMRLATLKTATRIAAMRFCAESRLAYTFGLTTLIVDHINLGSRLKIALTSGNVTS